MIDLGQKNRVLLVGAIKTGNHWCRFVVMNYYNILNNGATKTMTFQESNINRISGIDNLILDQKIEFYENLPSIKYCHSFHYDRINISKFNSVFDKFVYLIRNPFDQLISWFYYDIKHEELLKIINEIDLKEIWFFDDFVKQRLWKYIDHIKRNISHTDLVLNYDKLRKDPSDFRKLILLLSEEINEEVFQKAIEMSSFDNTKKMETRIRTQESLPEIQIMARKGTSGQYKDVMKPKLIEFIKKEWKEAGLDDNLL